MKFLKSFLCTAMAYSCLMADAAVGFSFDTSTAVDLTVTYADNIYTITTTGNDPHITSTALASDCTDGDAKLAFQYQSSEAISDFQVFFLAPDESESKSTHYANLIDARTAWTTASTNIANQKSSFSWGSTGNKLRFDFGTKAGVTIKIRQLGIYGTASVSDTDKNTQVTNLSRYLGSSYPAKVENVKVTSDKVIISGTAISPGKLLDVRMYGNVQPLTNYSTAATLDSAGTFQVEVPRYVTAGSYTYDRLLSRWAIVDASGSLQSHGHYADDVTAIRHASPGVLKSKKGLGGLTNQSLDDVADDKLGVHSVTINFLLNEFVSITPRSGYVEHEYCGRKYYMNAAKQTYHDNILKSLEKNGVVVAGIILIAPTGGDPQFAATMYHPEFQKIGTNTYYTMPDMGEIDAIHAYAAAIDYLANRYSQTGNGRVHHWVIHNEVDQHRSWTNMGSDPRLLRLVDTYEKSMRLVSNIVRQYDPNAYVLASFTSSWASTHGNGGFSAKTMLEHIVNYSTVEGDYRWGIAAHPYPKDFYKPAFWTADTDATYDENSGFSTFKNIEVISDWVLRREHYYKNEEKRILFFTENGVNSLDNSTANLNIQAAGAAWAWKKSKANSGVDAIMWHNWWDNPAEGICLGLRDSDLNPKPSWYVWQAAGTDNESAVLDQYKSTLGISDWSEIHKTVSRVGERTLRLEIDLATASNIEASWNSDYQYYSLRTSTIDPHIETVATTKAVSSNANFLSFDYKASTDLALELFFSPVYAADRSLVHQIKEVHDWKRANINISALRNICDWGGVGSKIRIDPGATEKTKWFIVRHMVINNGAIAPAARLSAKSAGTANGTLTLDSSLGTATMVTSGTDPYFFTNALETNLELTADKITFEYQASADIPNFKFYFCDNLGEKRSVNAGTLQATNEWKRCVVDISDIIVNHGWGFEGDYLRVDPGSTAGVTFKMRALSINNGSFTSEHQLLIDSKSAQNLSLSRDYDPDAATPESISQLMYNGWYINTTGSDPHFAINPLSINLNDDATKLHIVYKSSVNVGNVELFFLYPENAKRQQAYAGVMPATNEWKEIVLDIAEARKSYGWGYAGDVLRIDPGYTIGAEIQIQSLTINNRAEITTGVEETTDDSWSLCATNGGVIVNTNSPKAFTFFNLQGIPVANVNVDGQQFIPLATGMYIVNGKKIIVR